VLPPAVADGEEASDTMAADSMTPGPVRWALEAAGWAGVGACGEVLTGARPGSGRDTAQAATSESCAHATRAVANLKACPLR
jgi:hypothetical protein